MSGELEARYGLPREVVFCKRCIMSNQRPTSSIEFKHSATRQHGTLHIDADGLCDACQFTQVKEQIDYLNIIGQV